MNACGIICLQCYQGVLFAHLPQAFDDCALTWFTNHYTVDWKLAIEFLSFVLWHQQNVDRIRYITLKVLQQVLRHP